MAGESPDQSSGSVAAVAFELTELIIRNEGPGNFNDRKSILQLYTQCHDAAGGRAFKNIDFD